MNGKIHYLALWGKNHKLRQVLHLPRGGQDGIGEWNCHEAWAVTGAANVEEARRRVERVKQGADDGQVRRIKP